MKYNQKIGKIGEQIAGLYLEANGFEIIERNFRTIRGEIDIIAKKDRTIHFVEVKTRTNTYIRARQAIDKRKCSHIWKTAEYYLYKKKIKDVRCHIDAIEVYIESHSMKINYIEQIVEK